MLFNLQNSTGNFKYSGVNNVGTLNMIDHFQSQVSQIKHFKCPNNKNSLKYFHSQMNLEKPLYETKQQGVS